MTQIQENPKKEDQDKKNTGALNTEEILSLLSKTSQDFKKESEITENVSYLFNKKTLKDMALSNSQNLKKTEQPEIVDKEVKKDEIEEETNDDFENLYKGQVSKSGVAILPSKRTRRIPEVKKPSLADEALS